ncbi:hypothetical protein DFH07DRAFT_934857 [Mycena maculata]|uniref:Uncharacterized protein n=1 Tax=Mycena maculata TaxID=230809 RepID=A0AAD7P1R7_9AGAR|nr:hypothetical protein DFH07DRAFT_934857 [Mycena maculata]
MINGPSNDSRLEAKDLRREGPSVTESTNAEEDQALAPTRPNTPEPENKAGPGANELLSGGENQTSPTSNDTEHADKRVVFKKSSPCMAEDLEKALAFSGSQGMRYRYGPAINSDVQQENQLGGRYRDAGDGDDTDTEEEQTVDGGDDADTEMDEAYATCVQRLVGFTDTHGREAETLLTAAADGKRAVRFTLSTKAVDGDVLKNRGPPVRRGLLTLKQMKSRETNRETLKRVNGGSSSLASTSATAELHSTVAPAKMLPRMNAVYAPFWVYPLGGDLTVQQLAECSKATQQPFPLKRARENEDQGGDEQPPAQRLCLLRDEPRLGRSVTYRAGTKVKRG